MIVTRIIDRDLNFPVTEPKLQRALENLDTDGDGTITADDFEIVVDSFQLRDELIREMMHQAVADVFVSEGAIDESQRGGMVRFFDLYNDVKRANAVVMDWMRNHTDTWGKELEFGRDYYNKSVVPHITGSGILSQQGSHFSPFGAMLNNVYGVGVGLGLSTELYCVFSSLSKKPVDNMPVLGRDCGMWGGLRYNQNAIPSIIKSQSQELDGWYQAILAMLKGYRDVECEGAGCLPSDETSAFFLKLERGFKTENTHPGYCDRGP